VCVSFLPPVFISFFPSLPVREREGFLRFPIGSQRALGSSLLLSLSQRKRGRRESESGEAAGRRVATDGFTSGGCTEELWERRESRAETE